MTPAEVVAAVADDLYENLDAAYGYVPPPSHDPSLYRDDPYLRIADYARERFAAGDTLADNPYPPGSRAYMEFGGVMLDQLYDRR
jgi:hypothetical protein